jgi:uridine kinase
MKKLELKILLPEKNRKITVEKGSTLLELAEKFKDNFKSPILGAIYNNEVAELSREICENAQIEFITISHKDGYLFYLRSLIFVLIKAAKEMFPHAELRIEYSIGNGYYCWFEGLEWINAQEVEELENRMKEIVKADLPFVRKTMLTTDAVEAFKKIGLDDKVLLFKGRKQKHTSVYMLGENIGYFYGYLVPSTSALTNFKLTFYHKGIVLLLPDPQNPENVKAFKESPKFFSVIKENDKWLDILELDTCGKLNEKIREGHGKEIVLISEALHGKRLAEIADEIYRRKRVIKAVTIAGPSSSGKTSTANRLAVQLKVNGLKPFLISLDDYFIDRDKTPVGEDGLHDFESITAINVPLFNKNLKDLMEGHEVELPKYDFLTGKSVKSGKKLVLPENGVLIIEGIHGLNPKLITDMNPASIYRIYVSALTALNIDKHNRIPTTDCRMIRRMVRDVQTRGHDVVETIKRWPAVRIGEEKNIFPYQENADVMFNSSLVYELGVLKMYAEPLLKEVPQNTPEYVEAKRLLKFLSFFEPFECDSIPPNSIIREFIGGSVFFD